MGKQKQPAQRSFDNRLYFHYSRYMEIYHATDALAALSQETRLQIFRYLVRRGPEGAAAGEIGEEFGLPGATLSHHLNTLRQSGLVRQTRQGRSMIYAPDFAQMNALLGFLMDDCCAGQCTPVAMVDVSTIGRSK